MFRKYLLLVICSVIITMTYGQIADFPFDTDFIDDVDGYSPTIFGSPIFITDDGSQVLQLEGDEYLSLPNAVHEAIDPNQDLELQLRFKITDLYEDAPYPPTGQFGEDGRRVLVSNKSYYIEELGFDISVRQMDGEYRLLMSFGDEGNEGEWIFNDVIQQDTWVELKLIFRLNDDVPSLVYKLDGYYRHFPIGIIDASQLKSSLNTQQIWIGTDADNDQGFTDIAYAETSLDYFKIFNPVFVGDTGLFSTALKKMQDHVEGINILSDVQQRAELDIIVENWDDNISSIFDTDILDYIIAYEQIEGTVFESYGEGIQLDDLILPRALQFMLIQYSIDNLYTPSNVANMDGVSYQDHIHLPGIVEPNAPRVTETIAIDGDYNTNPGFYLNQQKFVIRPTGYYAAPGDIVEITVPAALVNQGVRIRVGAHAGDYRLDYRVFQRFPTAATTFAVENTLTSVANPLGGAIYFLLPDGSNHGSVSLTFDNAVKSPYYSTKAGFSNSLADYQADLTNSYVNWVDLESDNFMATIPRVLAEMSPDADDLLIPLNDMVGTYTTVTGRPSPKIRAEYIISEPASYTQGTIPASYPMSIVNGDLSEANPNALPISILDPAIFMTEFDGLTMIHELGHLHNMPTMDEEGETNVDMATVMALNTVLNQPLDTAVYYAGFYQTLDMDRAILDWMLDTKFRNFIPAEYSEMAYQLRGIAKYADVANLFSWDTLGLIHQHWYDQALLASEPPTGIENVSADEYMEVASDQLGFNFAPLWEIWGRIASPTLFNQLDSYDKEPRIKDRILHYRTLVPRDAAEFLVVYNSITPYIEEHHVERYDDFLTYYDESVADSILFRIDDILCKYYDTNCELTDIDILLEENAITLMPNPTTSLFEISGLMADYTIKVISINGTIIKTINCTGTSHFIDISELPPGVLFVEILNKDNSSICLKKILKQ